MPGRRLRSSRWQQQHTARSRSLIQFDRDGCCSTCSLPADQLGGPPSVIKRSQLLAQGMSYSCCCVPCPLTFEKPNVKGSLQGGISICPDNEGQAQVLQRRLQTLLQREPLLLKQSNVIADEGFWALLPWTQRW